MMIFRFGWTIYQIFVLFSEKLYLCDVPQHLLYLPVRVIADKGRKLAIPPHLFSEYKECYRMLMRMEY